MKIVAIFLACMLLTSCVQTALKADYRFDNNDENGIVAFTISLNAFVLQKVDLENEIFVGNPVTINRCLQCTADSSTYIIKDDSAALKVPFLVKKLTPGQYAIVQTHSSKSVVYHTTHTFTCFGYNAHVFNITAGRINYIGYNDDIGFLNYDESLDMLYILDANLRNYPNVKATTKVTLETAKLSFMKQNDNAQDCALNFEKGKPFKIVSH